MINNDGGKKQITQHYYCSTFFLPPIILTSYHSSTVNQIKTIKIVKYQLLQEQILRNVIC